MLQIYQAILRSKGGDHKLTVTANGVQHTVGAVVGGVFYATAGGASATAGTTAGGVTAAGIIEGIATWGSRLSGPVGAVVLAMTPTRIASDAEMRQHAAAATRESNQLHRGRIQAQGNGLEASVAWAQSTPPTAAQGLAMVEMLKLELTPKQLDERSRGFSQAERFIYNAGNAGGVSAPVSRSFPQGSAIRVDIEVKTGFAFIP